MVSSPQKIGIIHLQKAAWTAKTGEHLGALLSEQELDFLFSEIEGGTVQLWHVYTLNGTGNEHIATVCTRIEIMYDLTKHFVVIHGGGAFLETLPQIHDYLYQEAKNLGALSLRAIVGRRGVAKILKRRFGCRDFEYLLSKEVV